MPIIGRYNYSGYKIFCRYVWILLRRDHACSIPFSRVCSLMDDFYDAFERSHKAFYKGLSEQYKETNACYSENMRHQVRHVTKDQEDYQTWANWMPNQTRLLVEVMCEEHANQVSLNNLQ